MDHRTSSLDDLLTLTAPVDGPTPQTLASARTRLQAQLRDDLFAGRRARARRRFALAGAVAAAVAAAVVIPSVGVGGARPAASADAAEVLHRAALAAGVQPDGGWQDAAYWYSKSTIEQSGRSHTREIWIGHRDVGVLREGGDQVTALDVASFPAGASSITWDGLWDLPTDPAKLANQLRAGIHGAGNGDDSELFVIVGDLLRESPAPPKLRSALYDVAAQIPGVHFIGPVTDAAGRPGTAVDRDGQQLTFDPYNGRLLAETQGDPRAPDTVITDDKGNVVGGSTVGFASTYLEQGPRTSAPAATQP